MEKKKKNRPTGLTYKKKSTVNYEIASRGKPNENAIALLTNYEVSSLQSTITPNFTVITLDAEWGNGVIDVPITLQVYIPAYKQLLVIFNKDIFNTGNKIDQQHYTSNIYTTRGFGSLVFETSFSDPSRSPLYEGLCFLEDKKQIPIDKEYRLVFYYSPKDILYSLGKDLVKEAMFRGYSYYRNRDWITQKKTLLGRVKIYKSLFTLYDLSGATNTKGLVNLAGEYGISLENKDSMDSYKSNMLSAFLNNDKEVRKSYIKYAIQDTIVLSQIYYNRISRLNDVLLNVLCLKPKFSIEESRFPSSVGKFVEIVLINSIFNELEKHVTSENALKALYSMGYLNELNINYESQVLERSRLLKGNSPIEELEKHFNDKNYTYNAFNLGSISFLLGHETKSFIKNAAYVSGGRTTNERYKEIGFDLICDVDMVSCYGQAINQLPLPLGHPIIYSRHVNSIGLTLLEFRKKYGNSLVKGTYKIIVTGTLSKDKEQDLIYSRIFPKGVRSSSKGFAATYRKEGYNENFSLGEAVLLRNEIINGCITSDIIELIDNVANNSEKKDFNNLRVDSAIFYPKEYQCSTITEWVQKCLNNMDTIHNYWLSYPLSNIAQTLLSHRSKLKARIAGETDPDKRVILKSQELAVKLINNTTYGVLASPFFKVGNCVIAENITARGRTEVWKLSKALNGIQCITDGVAFQPEHVFELKKGLNSKVKKPGFHLLADSYRLKESRFVNEIALKNKNWELIYNNKIFDYNMMAKESFEHVNDFWQNYYITLKTNLEVKTVGIRSAHLLKSHYCIKGFDLVTKSFSDIIYKIRGCQEYDDFTGKRHPWYIIFDEIINKTFNIPKDLLYNTKRLLRVAEWKSNVKKDRSLLNDNDYEPGCATIKKDSLVKFHAKQFPFRNEKIFRRRKRSWESKEVSFHIKYGLNYITDVVKKMIEVYE